MIARLDIGVSGNEIKAKASVVSFHASKISAAGMQFVGSCRTMPARIGKIPLCDVFRLSIIIPDLLFFSCNRSTDGYFFHV
jgi:hypothetical protein